MAYSRKKLQEEAIKAIKKNDLKFIEEVVECLPCSKNTFYQHKLHEEDAISELLWENKVRLKTKLRKKWEDSDNFNAEKERAKKIAERIELIGKIFEEEKLDKKDSSTTFESALMELSDDKDKPVEEKIRDLVKDRKSKLNPNPVEDNGEDQTEEDDKGEGMTDEEARALIREAFED